MEELVILMGYLAVGWGIVLILLWIRPEYMFLLFYMVANAIIGFLVSDLWSLTLEDAPRYAFYWVLSVLLSLVIGAPFVALFKWLKTRKTGSDKKLDRDMERIRAEIAARDGQPPVAT